VASRAVASIRRSAALAAVLSFVFPGLGQGWVGAWRRGVLIALPILALIGFAAGTVVFEGRARTFGLLLQPEVLIGLVVANGLLLVYRLGVMLDAYLLAQRRWPAAAGRSQRIATAVILGALLLTTIGMHAGLGYVSLKTYDTITTVFAPDETPTPTAEPTPPSGGPSFEATPTPLPTPEPTPVPVWSTDGRLDLLLVGGDAGPGRFSLRTDTMILLSVDVATGRAAMFGIPRNMMNVPLPDGPAAAFACRCYPDLLNSLFVYAGAHPDLFRGGESRGYLAVQDAVSEMTGRPLDGMLVVTLQGFVRLVDALGGLDITTPYNVYDSHYPLEDGSGSVELWIPAGFHHFNGHDALAFARSRHQDSDYDRMHRQQLVLLALRRQVRPCDLVLRIPELLDIAKDSLWTNLPVRQLPDLLALANRVQTGSIAQFQFWPPAIPEALTRQALQQIRKMVADPFNPVAPASPAPSGPTPTPEPETPFC
jgi:polyisoprenyl-teichoic acid--peptidoglycan teichoic acid transferase